MKRLEKIKTYLVLREKAASPPISLIVREYILCPPPDLFYGEPRVCPQALDGSVSETVIRGGDGEQLALECSKLC